MSLLDNPFGMKPRQSPDDIYRLLAYGFVMICMFMAYDVYIERPRLEALEKLRQAEMGIVEAVKPEPVVRDIALAEAADTRVSLENSMVKASIDLTGARLDDLTLKTYFEDLEKTKPVALLSPAGTKNPQLVQYGWLSDDETLELPDGKTVWSVKEQTKSGVTLTWTNPQKITFEQTYSLDDKVVFKITQDVTNKSGKPITLYPFGRVAREGLPDIDKNAILHEGMIAYVNENLTQEKYGAMDKKRTLAFDKGEGWIGTTEKYWLAALLNPAESGTSDYRFTVGEGTFDRPLYQADLRSAPQDVGNNVTKSSVHYAYVGPKEIDLLDYYSEELKLAHFDLAIDFGRFYFLTRPFFWLLNFLSTTVGSFAIGLLLTSLVIRAATFPLANTTYRSFAKLRKLQPEMAAMKEKYGANRALMQQELFKLYTKEKVNPAAGCFPLLLQIPIFFALYKVLFITIGMRHEPFFGWIKDMSAPDPTSILNLFGALPFDAPEFAQIGIWPCIYCFSMILLQRLQPPPQDGQQRMIMTMMPFLFTFMLAGFPAGMVIYWSWSNLLSIIQQSIIMKSMGVEIHLFKFGKKTKSEQDDVFIVDASEAAGATVIESVDVTDQKVLTPPKRKKKK